MSSNTIMIRLVGEKVRKKIDIKEKSINETFSYFLLEIK